MGEVTSLKLERDGIELKENTPDGRLVVRRLPGRWSFGDLAMNWDLSADSGPRQWWEDWVRDSRAGSPEGARRNGSTVVFDAADGPALCERLELECGRVTALAACGRSRGRRAG